jgi:hypothetical protein
MAKPNLATLIYIEQLIVRFLGRAAQTLGGVAIRGRARPQFLSLASFAPSPGCGGKCMKAVTESQREAKEVTAEMHSAFMLSAEEREQFFQLLLEWRDGQEERRALALGSVWLVGSRRS